MTTPKESPAASVVELVLREHELVAALPIAVRTIRRFAEAPLLVTLKRMTAACASVRQVEQIVVRHREDMRLEALERGPEQAKIHEPDSLSESQLTLVNDVLLFGAKHGSARIAEWALLHALPGVRIDKALKAAVDSGQLGVVQLLYPRATEFSMESSDDALLESAALLGHLEVFQWIHDNRRNSNTRCFLLFALRCAASSGHLEIVKWIHSKDPGTWTHVALEQAALHGQQHVMDWINDERLPVSASFAMRSVAWKGDWQTLAWLHENYPEDKSDSNTLAHQHSSSPLQKSLAMRSALDFGILIRAVHFQVRCVTYKRFLPSPHQLAHAALLNVIHQTHTHTQGDAHGDPERNLPASVLDLVLRDHELVALPAAVRDIRQFAEPPLLITLKRMVVSRASVAQMERVLAQRYEDARLEALERGHEGPKAHVLPETVANDQVTLIVNGVLMFGATRGSPQIVEWALLRTPPCVPVSETLRAAANNSHFAAVQLLYPRVTEFRGSKHRSG